MTPIVSTILNVPTPVRLQPLAVVLAVGLTTAEQLQAEGGEEMNLAVVGQRKSKTKTVSLINKTLINLNLSNLTSIPSSKLMKNKLTL